MSSIFDTLIDQFLDPLVSGILCINSTVFGLGIRIIGPFFILGFYGLLGVHTYAYFKVTLVVLAKKLGATYGLFWVALGLCLLYNVVFNHFLSFMVKPGNPKSLEVSAVFFIPESGE